MEKVIVLVEFADKYNFAKKYKVGEELKVADFGKERVANLVERGLVSDGKDNKDEPVTDIDLTANYQKIIAQVKIFEDVEKLEQYLAAEKAVKSPRSSVVKAIEERLVQLGITN